MVRKKILITGASGYLGSRLSFYLSRNGFDIVALCNSRIPQNNGLTSSIHFVLKGDLRDHNTLIEIEKIKPDYIIHLVSLDHNKSGKDIQETLQINVQTTWDLLEISKKINVEKFIYFSTVQVYGNSYSNVVDENTTTKPINAYGLTHLLSENIVNYYKESQLLNATSFRLSNSYGEPVNFESNSWSLVVNNICKSAFFEKKIILRSDGSDSKDFIHYSTICQTIEIALKYDLQFDNIYNLCSGTSISVLSLAFLVKKIYKTRYLKDINIFINDNMEIDFHSSAEVEMDKCMYSNEKLKAIFNINDIDLDEGINTVFDYLEMNIYN